MKLYDFASDVPVTVGSVVRYGGKPHVVEHIGEKEVTIVTMTERKYTLRVLPKQIGCVGEVREEWEDEDGTT